MNNLHKIVDFLPEVVVKSQSFATFHILMILKYNNKRKVSEDIIANLSEDKYFLDALQDENID